MGDPGGQGGHQARGILYEPVGDGPFKNRFGAGLWVGDASKRPQGATQSLGVKDEILFTRQFKDHAHVKSAGGNEGRLYINTTACRIGGISFDFPAGQTLTKVEVGKGDRTATSGVTDGTIRNLLVLFNPPVAQGEYIWLRTPALTVADKIKYKLVFVENDPCAKDVMAAPQPGGELCTLVAATTTSDTTDTTDSSDVVALQALPLPDDDVAAAVSAASGSTGNTEAAITAEAAAVALGPDTVVAGAGDTGLAGEACTPTRP